MNPARLMPQDATITRRTQTGAADPFGDPTVVEMTETSKCWLDQSSRREQTDGQSLQWEEWRLFLPPDVVVEGADKITVDGVAYELFGPPWRAINPRTGVAEHIEATVRRTS